MPQAVVPGRHPPVPVLPVVQLVLRQLLRYVHQSSTLVVLFLLVLEAYLLVFGPLLPCPLRCRQCLFGVPRVSWSHPPTLCEETDLHKTKGELQSLHHPPLFVVFDKTGMTVDFLSPFLGL